jgi:antitoxin component YwqK of YwqJK toxin-antitoxin module
MKFQLFAYSFTALLLIFQLDISAQLKPKKEDIFNQLDKEGKKNGFWKVKNTQGRLVWEGKFKNGTPVGEFKHYDEIDGSLFSIINYRENGQDAWAEFFHPNGKPKAKGIYKNKAKDSTWIYFNEDGILIADEHYENNKKVGIWKMYYPSGAVSQEVPYADGIENGPTTQYFDTGKIKFKTVYKNGFYDGEAIWYHPNGKKRITGNYQFNVRHGLFEYYKENGSYIGAEKFDKGKLISKPLFNNEVEFENPEKK